MRELNLDKILERTERDPCGCLLWQGALNSSGYGVIRIGTKADNDLRLAHRAVYEIVHGPIPTGYHVDHVAAKGCLYTNCVNPDHLEAVTPRENLLRGTHPNFVTARTGVCARGHKLTGDNVRTRPSRPGAMWCRACEELMKTARAA